MSFVNTVNTINANAAVYAPAAINGVLAVEQAAAGLPGQTKSDIVVNTIVTGTQAAAKIGEALPVPSVQAVSALVDIIVSILNAAGVFKKRNSTPAAAAPVDQPK